ncbi:hypothetical protein [Deinococcus sp.]|uniref:hypothetical protein n=1 Tax=Deinococcus sp. TaxID=47478 RepID=UPI0025BE4587|nr:hypothetical protein [Deinococcus sp.]
MERSLRTLALSGLMLSTLGFGQFALGVGVAAGTEITNQGFIDYLKDDGKTSATISSNTVTATVTRVYAVDVSHDAASLTSCASTSTVVYGTASAVLTYTLTNPGNGADSYTLSTSAVDAGGNPAGTATVATSPVSLAADASTPVEVAYTLPTAQTVGAVYHVNLNATSVGDTTQTDTTNVQCIQVVANLDLTFKGDNGPTIVAPGSTTAFTHTLTNTGTGPLSSSNTTLSAAHSDTAFTATYTFGDATDPANPPTQYATAQEAFAALGDLAPGASATLTVTVKAPLTAAAGKQDKLTITADINDLDPATTGYTNLQTTPASVTDTLVIGTTAATLQKTQAVCTLENGTLSCAAPSTDAIKAKPCELIGYVLTATNTGQLSIPGASIRDAIPNSSTLYSIKPTNTTNPLLVKIGNGNYVPLNTITYPIAATTTVSMAYDMNKDTLIDAKDLMPVSTSYGVTLLTRVETGAECGAAPVIPTP